MKHNEENSNNVNSFVFKKNIHLLVVLHIINYGDLLNVIYFMNYSNFNVSFYIWIK